MISVDTFPTRKSIRGSVAEHPLLSKEWHPTKNLPLRPSEVSAGTSNKHWWQCEKDHEWQARGDNRIAGKGCPYCGNRRISKTNNMAATHPDLAKQWHPTKNLPLTADQVIAGTSKKHWWQCEQGDEWQASGSNRATGRDCPYCSNHILSKTNNLAATHPDLAKGWHPTKNLPLTAEQVFAGTNNTHWWQCEQRHEWQARGDRRVLGDGCPYCSNHRISKSNNLAATHPDLAKGWHPTKNLPLTAEQVFAGTNKKRWWQCEQGHEWRATGSDRLGGKGCPRCQKQSKLEVLGWDLLTELHLTFSKQHPIGRYLIDALVSVSSTLSLVVEFDGCFWHGCVRKCGSSPTSRQLHVRKRDALRDQRLTAQGYRVVRICEEELKQANKQGAGAQFLHSKLFPT